MFSHNLFSLETLVSRLFFIFAVFFSFCVVSLQITVPLGMKFGNVANFLGIFTLFFFCYLLYIFRNFLTEWNHKEPATKILFFLMLLGGMLSLFSLRQHGDDLHYMAKVVYFYENPWLPMDFTAGHFAFEHFDTRIIKFLGEVIDYYWGMVAYFIGVHPLAIYHLVVPFIFGAAIPAVWFLLISKFVDKPLNAVIGSAMITGFLCIDGASNLSYGNFAFIRIYEGKAIMLSILIPLFTAFSIDFFHERNLINWTKLFILAVFSAGVSTSSVFIIPALIILLSSGFFFANGFSRNNFRTVFYYGLSAIQPVLIGLIIFSWMTKFFGVNSIIHAGWRKSFADYFTMQFGDWTTPSSFLLFSSLLLLFVLLKGKTRRFVLGWVFLLLLTFLNPFLSDFMSSKLTSPNGYWRLFYLLPCPLAFGLAVALILERFQFKEKFAYKAVVIMTVTFFILNSSSFIHAVFQNRNNSYMNFPPTYKINSDIYNDVQIIINKSPEGPMLAPIRYSRVIPMITYTRQQLVMLQGGKDILLLTKWNGNVQDGIKRLMAVNFISAPRQDGLTPFWDNLNVYGNNYKTETKSYDYFIEFLQRGLKSVVVDTNLPSFHLAEKTLIENDFKLIYTGERFLLYTKNSKEN
ncbi:MAG: hypothetical protein HQK84_06495 [Nitrospinae bacterium]|nr:hypothetical protein [Nitrospinota bacterium]